MTHRIETAASGEGDSLPINLLLADVRQALFDEAKGDPTATSGLRYEAGRAVGLMGRSMDTIKALAAALTEAREEIAANRSFIFEAHTVAGHAETLDDDVRPTLAGMDSLLGRIDTALAKARGDS